MASRYSCWCDFGVFLCTEMCVLYTLQTTADVQKQYLAGVHYLFEQGVALPVVLLFQPVIVFSQLL